MADGQVAFAESIAMSVNNAAKTHDETHALQVTWPVLLKKLAIWALFLGMVYLIRDFFFIAFMTFLFSYLTLAIVGRGMRRLAPGQDRPGLRRLLTIGVFVVVPLILLGIGVLVGPSLLSQGQHLAGWLSHVNPETEVSRLLKGIVGPFEFKANFGGPEDPRFQKGLEEFRQTGVLHVAEYNQFPSVQAYAEGGFSKQFADSQRARIKLELAREGTSSKDFENWFIQDKFLELLEQARKQLPELGRSPVPVDPLVRAAASAKPEQVLEQVRRDAPTLAKLRQEWIADETDKGVEAALQSDVYQQEFRKHYEQRRADSPTMVPYTFEQYVELKQVRPQGEVAFGKAVDNIKPTAEGSGEAQLLADFEAAKQQELFQKWWSTSALAKLIRQRLEGAGSGAGASQMEHIITTLMRIPVDLATALLLSFFICIDFPALRRAARVLRETWLRDAYDEMAPALSSLGQLTGRALHAQGLIALCNATMMFIALTFLGVEHPVLLSAAVFVLCLVPTLGTIIAWVLIAAVALIQPGGGFLLALKVSGAVIMVVLLETFVFSPRILGRMMELHPVLIMAILPLAQYFFGVWGLILATPVAVYVIHVLILGKGLPGIDAEPQAKLVAAGPSTPNNADATEIWQAAQKV
jgi:predicted PurR-regulated permease PerM